jgi:hypothetical protein
MIVAMAAVPVLLAATRDIDPGADPLTVLSPAGRAKLTRGEPVVEIPRLQGDDIAITGAVPTSADSERLVAWSRQITALYRGKYVPLTERFSNPARLEDLASLTLEDEELEDLRDCRPGRCKLKLSAAEVRQVRSAIDAAGDEWRRAAMDAFRAAMLARARAFQAHGFHGVQLYEDDKEPVDPAAEFRILLERFGGDPLFTPRLADHLRTFRAGAPEVESFVYWSKDLLGDAKPIVSITHVSILHGTAGAPTIVAATQIYASHYLNASLSLTAVYRCPQDGRRYLFYLRRTRADVFSGTFGGLIKRIVTRRIRTEGPPLLAGFRDKLERGVPSNVTTAHREYFTPPAESSAASMRAPRTGAR